MTLLQRIWLVILLGVILSPTNCLASSDLPVYTDSIPTHTQAELEVRLWKNAAQNILGHKVELGYSHAMVFLSLRKPYLIEESSGKGS